MQLEYEGSPGNNNADVKRYDETLLRSTLSATHEAQEASIRSYLPTHLCTSEWEKDAESIIAHQEARGLPPVPGRPTRMTAPAWVKDGVW